MNIRPWMSFAAAAAIATCGCAPSLYNPSLATRAYPQELHTTNVADMHVFRDETKLYIVNSTAHSYTDFDLWINQRYVKHVDSLPVGATIRLSLWDFVDERGDIFNAGGFFRTYEPTPVRLVEIQQGGSEPMLGLVAIRSERAK